MAVKRWLKSLMFRGQLLSTIGELEVPGHPWGSVKIKVHKLSDENVGLELSMRHGLSWTIVPVTLAQDEAAQLAQLLQAQE